MSFPEKPGLKFFYEIIGCHWSWSDPKYGCFRSLTSRRRCGWWRCARRTTATGAWARAAGRAADTCRGSAGVWLVDSGHVTSVVTSYWCRTHNAAFTILHFLADSNFSRAGGMVRSCVVVLVQFVINRNLGFLISFICIQSSLGFASKLPTKSGEIG